MDRLVELARSMVPSKWTVAKVRARGDDPSLHLLQVSGRHEDFLARAQDSFAADDDVLVLLEPSVHAPHIVGLSPWKANFQVTPSTNNGTPWQASDIAPGELDAAIHSNLAVAMTVAVAHARQHSITSTADHSDVSGTPTNHQMLRYDGTTWRPASMTVTLDGGTRS